MNNTLKNMMINQFKDDMLRAKNWLVFEYGLDLNKSESAADHMSKDFLSRNQYLYLDNEVNYKILYNEFKNINFNINKKLYEGIF